MREAGARPQRYRVGQRVRVTNPRLAAYGQVGEIIRVDTPGGGYHVRLEEERPVPPVLFFLPVELAAEPEASPPAQA